MIKDEDFETPLPNVDPVRNFHHPSVYDSLLIATGSLRRDNNGYQRQHGTICLIPLFLREL